MSSKTAAQAALGRGYALAVAAAAFLSTTAIFIRYLTQSYAIPALVLALWRDVFVVATLVPIFAIARPRLLRLSPRQLPTSRPTASCSPSSTRSGPSQSP